MDALCVGGAGILSGLYIMLAIMLIIAPLMIWSKASQTVTLLRETNIYLKHIAASTGATATLAGGQIPPGTPPQR